MKSKILGLLAVGMLAGPMAAEAASINFDDGAGGNSVGAFYSSLGVTFSNASFTNNFSLVGSSGPLGIRSTSNSYQWLSSTPVVATFSFGVGLAGITGLDVGANGLRIDAYDAAIGGNLIDFEVVFGTSGGVGQFFIPSVSAPSIYRLEIYQVQNITGDGIILDNFFFERASVPEPGTLALLGLGLVGLGLSRRRKAN